MKAPYLSYVWHPRSLALSVPHVANMLLHTTAGNFLTEEAGHWLELLFELEDLLLPELGGDSLL